MESYFALAFWTLAAVVVWIAFKRSRRRRSHYGPGTVGTVYDLLNEDKRNAVEMIIEERAEARDPEDKDGNLPELQSPAKPR